MKNWLLFWILSFTSILSADSFEQLMGKGTSDWKYVQTPEDVERVEFFSKLYQKQISRLETKPKSAAKIPKVAHFIWLGPDNFPKKSTDRIAKWIQLHPEWTFFFWTDQKRSAPHSSMKVRSLTDFGFLVLGNEYDHSTNYGEKAKILAYEILMREGGVTIDHDMLPYKAFDSFNEHYDFYCGLEKPAPSILSSSVIPGTQLIASRQNHPVLRETIQWLSAHWDQLEQSYPGQNRAELSNRIAHRSFWALSEGIDRGIDKQGNSDIVFPTRYFNDRECNTGAYAIHFHDSEWSHPSTQFETRMQNQFKEMLKEDDEAVMLTLFLAGVSFLGCVLLLVYAKSVKAKLHLFLLLLAGSLGAGEFSHLMGEKTPHWQYVHQQKDIDLLDSLEELYTRNQHHRFQKEGSYKIPKIIHFIWLGPRPFPPESVENVRTWIAQNPDWRVKFWTDRERLPPCKGMEVCSADDFPFLFLRRCYEDSENWGEKSDILRFEILYQEGGVYSDHDANCLQPFEGLHRGYDFYCGLEAPHPPFAGRNITCGNGVIGSKAFHPVVRRVIELISGEWKELGSKYRGRDGYSRTQLVMERTYMKLTNALHNHLEKDGNVDIAFPSAYFFAKKGIPTLYSKHFYADSWSSGQTRDPVFEKSTKKAMGKLQKRNHTIRWIGRGALSLNLLVLIGIFFTITLQKRKSAVS